MVGGTFAVNAYTGMNRATKDLDVFTKASDCPKIMHAFAKEGFRAIMEDERWLDKMDSGSDLPE